MVKRNRINEICEAIAEIREIMASGSVQSGLLRESLEQKERALLNDLFEEVNKKPRQTKRTKTAVKKAENSNRPMKGGGDDSR